MRGGSREEVGKVAAGVDSQGDGYEQEGPGAAVWRHSGLGTDGGRQWRGGWVTHYCDGWGWTSHRKTVRHTVWRKQLTDSTRQLKLDVDRARQGTELEMLDGAELYSVMGEAAAGLVVRGPSPEAGPEPAAAEEEWEEEEWEDWSVGIL